MANSALKKSEPKKRTFDQVFHDTGRYGGYQIFCFITLQYAWLGICTSFSNSFLSLGGLKPTYICHDSDFLNVTDACLMIRNCSNLTIISQYVSVYEEFEWACLPASVPMQFASLLGIPSIIGSLLGGHIADHYGRKWPVFICVTIYYACGFATAFAPTWQFYMAFLFTSHFVILMTFSCIYCLAMETVNRKYRLLQGFGFQWTLSFMFAGLVSYLTGHWRKTLLVAMGSTVPCLLAIFVWVESPRWLIQKHRYKEAAAALNRIAWFNRKKQQFTEEMMENIDLGPVHDHKYNVFHLFSSRKLILYTVSMAITGISLAVVAAVVFMNIQDLAGSPYMNTALFGFLRIWAPIAVLFERKIHWFGRRMQLLCSTGTVIVCFLAIVVIYATGLRESLHSLATGLALFGFAVTISWALIAFDQFSSELFPTVIRTIAISSIQVFNMLGNVVGPQLVYLGSIWPAMPYAGAAALLSLGFCLTYIILPETKGKCLPDTLEAMKMQGKEKKLVVKFKDTRSFVTEIGGEENGTL